MGRKQVGLKFDEEDLARWDVFAEAQGWSRTTLFETAVERLIGAGGEQAPAPKVAESQAPTGERKHLARPGVRRAFICTHRAKPEAEACNRRVFLPAEAPAATVPDCPEHGPMVRQANRPYLGQSTEPTPEQGWPEAKA